MRTNVNFNKQKYVVLLIGASEYKNTAKFANIPNVKANIEKMRSVFLDKRYIGVSDRNMIVSLNEDSVTIKHALTKACRLAKNSDYTLFVYYSGHGIINPDNYKLYFATSDMDANYLGDDALEAKSVLDKINRSAASRKIFVVDACHSGGIHNTMGDTTESTLMKNYEGVHFVSACDEDSTALFPKNKPNEPTYFTGALLDRVSGGMDINSPFLTLRDIVEDIAWDFMGKNLPKPQQSSMLNADKMPFVKNVRAKNMKFESETVNYGKVVDSFNVSTANSTVIESKTVKNDNEMWKMVCNANTVAMYNDYITAFPYGVHVNEAAAKISDIMDRKSAVKRFVIAAAVAFLATVAMCMVTTNGSYNTDNVVVVDSVLSNSDSVKIASDCKQYVYDDKNMTNADKAESLIASNDDMYLNTATQIFAEEAENNPGNAEIVAKAENAKAAQDAQVSKWISYVMVDAELIIDSDLKSDAIENIDKILSNVEFGTLYCDMEDLRKVIVSGDQTKVNEWLAAHPQYRK